MASVLCPRVGCFFRRSHAARMTLRPHRFHCRLVLLPRRAPSRRRFGLSRERGVRRRLLSFALQGVLNCARPLRRRLSLRRRAMSAGIGPLSALPRPLARLPLFRRRQIDTGPPRFGQSNRNRLLRRSRAVFPFANVLDLLANKLAGLRAGRFSLALISRHTLQGLLLRHKASLSSNTFYWPCHLDSANEILLPIAAHEQTYRRCRARIAP